MTIPEIEQIIQKVQTWINEEQGWKFEVSQNNNALVNMVVHPNDFQNVNVLFDRVQPHKLIIKTTADFDEDDKRSYFILTEDEKKEFLLDIEILLIQINVIYIISPEPPRKIDSIELTKQIYFDALTRDKFFDGILAILRGLQVVRLNYNSLRSTDTTLTSMR
jgi:hypothetical protein